MRRSVPFAALICAISSACADTASDPAPHAIAEAPATTEVPGGFIHGRLLERVELAPEHSLSFYEFEPGSYLMHESRNVDLANEAMLEGREPMSMADAYRLATGAEAPRVLVDADALALRSQQRSAAVDADVGVQNQALILDEVDDPRTPIIIPAPTQPCSQDMFGDNWGERWFTANVCNQKNIRKCVMNKRFHETGNQRTRDWVFSQFEGDFNNIGHAHGARLPSTQCEGSPIDPVCTRFNWLVAFDVDVLPRHVESFAVKGGYPSAQGRAWAWSACSHGGSAMMLQ